MSSWLPRVLKQGDVTHLCASNFAFSALLADGSAPWTATGGLGLKQFVEEAPGTRSAESFNLWK